MRNKDKSINSLINRLNLKEHNWVVIDHWESDECAIGIANPHSLRILVYISTFGKDSQKYDYAP